MKSYFGGFLCCAWSPTGRFLAAGGEDDLISVMSTETGKIICRCQGTQMWIHCHINILFHKYKPRKVQQAYIFQPVLFIS